MTENLLRANIIVLRSHIALYLLFIYSVSFLGVRLSDVNLGAAPGPTALLYTITHPSVFAVHLLSSKFYEVVFINNCTLRKNKHDLR